MSKLEVGWAERAGQTAADQERGRTLLDGRPMGSSRPANWKPGSRWAPGVLREPNPDQLERSKVMQKRKYELGKGEKC